MILSQALLEIADRVNTHRDQVANIKKNIGMIEARLKITTGDKTGLEFARTMFHKAYDAVMMDDPRASEVLAKAYKTLDFALSTF